MQRFLLLSFFALFAWLNWGHADTPPPGTVKAKLYSGNGSTAVSVDPANGAVLVEGSLNVSLGTTATVNQGNGGTSPWLVTGTLGRSWLLSSSDSVTALQGGAPWSFNLTELLGSALNATNPVPIRVSNGTTYVDPTQIRSLQSTTDSVTAVLVGTPTVTANAGSGTFLVQVTGQPISTLSAQSGTWTTGRTWTLGQLTDSMTAFQGTSPWITSITNFPASFIVNQGTSPWVTTTGGTVNIAGTVPVSIAALPLGTVSISGTVPVTLTSTQITNGTISAQQLGAWSVTANAGTGTFTVGQSSGANLHTNVDNFPSNQNVTITAGTSVVNQGTSPWQIQAVGTTAVNVTNPISISGTVPVSLLSTQITSGTISSQQLGSWSVTSNQGTSPWVDNVSQFGGNNIVTGLGTSGLGIPRVTVSSDSNIQSTQSGTWNVGITGTPAVSVVGTVPVSLTSTQITNGTISAQQLGTWTVGLTGGTVGIAGTVPVSIAALPIGTMAINNFPLTQNVLVTGGTSVVNQGTSPWLTSAQQSGTWTVGLTGGTVSLSGTSAVTVSSGTITVNNPIDATPATQNITAQDTSSTTTAGANGQSIITGTPTASSTASFALAGYESIEVMASGTWTGTIQTEVSMDSGITWLVRGIKQTGSPYLGTSFTSNFEGGMNYGGMTNFRVRATAAMTGTAVIRIVASLNAASIIVSNPLTLRDSTTQSIANTIKAASTAAAASDTALVVALSPNSPASITGGTIGAVQNGTWTVGLTGGTVGSLQLGTWTVGLTGGTVGIAGTAAVNITNATTAPIAGHAVNSTFTNNYGTTALNTAGTFNVIITSTTTAINEEDIFDTSGLDWYLAYASTCGALSTGTTAIIVSPGGGGKEFAIPSGQCLGYKAKTSNITSGSVNMTFYQ